MALKNSGIDASTVQGVAADRTYLVINDEPIEIRDARKYWGQDAFDFADEILADAGIDKASICTIGQAGKTKLQLLVSLLISIVSLVLRPVR